MREGHRDGRIGHQVSVAVEHAQSDLCVSVEVVVPDLTGGTRQLQDMGLAGRLQFLDDRLQAIKMGDRLEHARFIGGLKAEGGMLQTLALPGILRANQPTVEK